MGEPRTWFGRWVRGLVPKPRVPGDWIVRFGETSAELDLQSDPIGVYPQHGENVVLPRDAVRWAELDWVNGEHGAILTLVGVDAGFEVSVSDESVQAVLEVLEHGDIEIRVGGMDTRRAIPRRWKPRPRIS